MATVEVIIFRVLSRLSEINPAAPTHWQRSEILDYLREGANELNLIAGEIQATISVPVNTTENVYALPAPSIAALSISSTNTFLFKQSIDDLDNEKPNWEAVTEVASRPRIWSPLGLNQIVIWPRATASLEVAALMEPDAISDADMSVGFREEYTPALEDYCVSRALFKEGGAEFQQSLGDYQKFLGAAQELAGRNVFEEAPAWTVAPKTATAQTTLRKSSEPAK
jgi:hypothetical protein